MAYLFKLSSRLIVEQHLPSIASDAYGIVFVEETHTTRDQYCGCIATVSDRNCFTRIHSHSVELIGLVILETIFSSSSRETPNRILPNLAYLLILCVLTSVLCGVNKVLKENNNNKIKIQSCPFIYKPGEHRKQSRGEKNTQNYEPNEFDRVAIRLDMMIQSGMHGRNINECRSNDCLSNECRRNNCRSNDCRRNETTPTKGQSRETGKIATFVSPIVHVCSIHLTHF
jgi:hypothetical protein